MLGIKQKLGPYLLATTVLVAGNAQAIGLSGIDLQFIADSNPAKADLDQDIEATNSVKLRATGFLFASELSNTAALSSGVSLNASASYEHNADIAELGESVYRLSLDGFREQKQQRGVPFYRFGLGASYLDSETFIRDSVLLDVSASINLQPAPFFDTTLGVRAEVREAETEVFDTTKTQVFLTANFSPFARMVVRTGFRYITGNEVFTASPSLANVSTDPVIEPDLAFGGVAANRFAYLIDADSAIVEAGLGYEFSNSFEANVIYRYISTSADGDIDYQRNMLELTLSLNL